MKKIPLTQGKFALVDDEDYEFLMQWKWHFSGGYAVRMGMVKGKGRRPIYMHKVIMKSPKTVRGDHIDHNTINNQKYNLRDVTHQQNMMNQLPQKGRSSKYKGVDWVKNRKKWRVAIKKNGKAFHIGCFENEDEAAKAYNKKALEMFGEFACLNKVN